ncbi:MAG: arginyltransferase [Planctomycetota bacterium]
MASGYVHTGTCAYLPDREWALRMRLAPRDDAVYRRLLETCHRRSGNVVYAPVCQGCRACRPIRVPVDAFRPTKSQRRCLRKNGDLVLEVGPPEPTREKLELHNRFVRARFSSSTDKGFDSLESYAEVFGPSPVTTWEMRFVLEGKLVGLGLVDALPEVLSSVYFFFDPDHAKRSLGTFSAIMEIELARETGRRWLYLGYYVHGCREMSYKARFRPCELLGVDGEWRPFDPTEAPSEHPG